MRLTSENLRTGLKFNLKNGPPATAHVMNSIKTRAMLKKLRPKEKSWYLLNNDKASCLVVKVKVGIDTVQLIYYAPTEEALHMTVRQLQRNLEQGLEYTDYIIYNNTVYLWFERPTEYLRRAVEQGVSPRIAALFLAPPKLNIS
jgi:hypothetical protein